MSEKTAVLWGRDRHALLTVEEVWRLIAREVKPLDAIDVSLGEAAGHVLAAPVVIGEDYPAFDKAMMDGFAVRAADCSTPGAHLDVVGLAPAGTATTGRIANGQAVRINTGAPVPPGADAVVMVEKTTRRSGGKKVRIDTAVAARQNIEPRGNIQRKGDIALTPPVRIAAGQIAAAATAGAARLTVFRRPDVAIVVTGSELRPPGSHKTIGQIHDSNGPMLSSLMAQFHASPRPVIMAPDVLDDLKTHLAQALTAPVVIVAGGMSMGTLDLVPKAIEELNVQWLFHGVSLRPGKPMAYGRGPAGQHVFGLPGNPVSAFVCAWAFVKMVIDGLQGLPVEPPQRCQATLTKHIKPPRDQRLAFMPARAWTDPQRGLMAEPCPWRGSSDPYGLALANALLVHPCAAGSVPAGNSVEIILTGSGDR